MKFLFVCIASLVHFSASQATAPSFTAVLNEIPQFTDEPAIQKLISDDAELDRFQETFYKSDNLPSTCGFQFSILSSDCFTWEINCQRLSTYVNCAEGELVTMNEGARIDIEKLTGKAKIEVCPHGKQSLAAFDELARLLKSNNPIIIRLYDLSRFEIFKGLDYKIDGEDGTIRSSFFDVLLSSQIITPAQVPSLGYYGKYGYRTSPDSIRELTKAVSIINKISIIDIREHLQSEQIDAKKVKKRFNIKSILKKHNKFKNFVNLLKHLYGKLVRLSEKAEKTNKELVQTMDEIVALVKFLFENEDGKIVKAILALDQGRWMIKEF